MDKVLYICHGFQNTGWGRAAHSLILALDAAGVDVVWRPIKLNGDSYKPEGRLLELLEKDIDGANICIQHVLPQYLSYNSTFCKNIAYFVAETLDWGKWSGFRHNINLMDELWVPNTEMAANSQRFIKSPIKVVPHACDLAKYTKQGKDPQISELDSAYNFYFIGEWNRRKRIGALIQAFNLEFKKTEPVNLVIKTYKAGAHPHKLGEEIYELSKSIKLASKLYKDPSRYPHEIIISSYMPEEELIGLHQKCHCFVSASYGEAWGWSEFDAMAYGNGIICPDIGGPKDFLKYSWGFGLDGGYKPVFGMHEENFSNYNSSNEEWFDINVKDLKCKMRMVYESKIGVQKNTEGIKIAERYSHENIGNLMKGLLNDSGN